MKTLKLEFFLVTILMTIFLQFSNLKGQPVSDLENWRIASFVGQSTYGKKTFDVFYDESVSIKDGIIFLNIMELYTEYGKKVNIEDGKKSSETGSALSIRFLTIAVKDSKLNLIRCVEGYEDGTNYEVKIPKGFNLFLAPSPGSIGAYYVRLATKLARGY